MGLFFLCRFNALKILLILRNRTQLHKLTKLSKICRFEFFFVKFLCFWRNVFSFFLEIEKKILFLICKLNRKFNGTCYVTIKWEESPDVSCLDSLTSPDNVFAESLKLNECVEILMNCLENLEKEAKELKDLASSNNANQINGERQLLDLKGSTGIYF